MNQISTQTPKATLQKRRKKFADSMDENSAALFLSAEVHHRNSDVEHKFRQDSSFWYLTGFNEPDSALLIVKTKKETVNYIFSRPRDKEKEIWTGKIAGPERAKEITGVDKCFEFKDLDGQLEKLLTGLSRLYFEFSLANYHFLRNKILETAKHRRIQRITSTQNLIGELRLFKEPFEIQQMKQAAKISAEAHKLAMQRAKPGKHECTLEGIIEGHFCLCGAGWAYPSIVASGANATILHYTANDQELKKGDLLLVDAGSEYNYYASDITRTFPIGGPVGGKFSKAQKQAYELVLSAQKDAIAQCYKKEVTFESVHEAAVKVLCEGLLDLGLLKGKLSDNIKNKTFRKFYMHKTSHWLGLDVHDVGSYVEPQDSKRVSKTASAKTDTSRILRPGMVITVEPGLYFDPEDTNIPKEFRGIGVRIEDDVLITKTGAEILTSACPKEVDELEEILGL
ncbi:MAG: aminopeptidase P N-terminal domain-containing protein [Candidatus Caenarcaniphilales bacterium]|nr:aminopeptidase P N-terminal domain-containing protein [Candidatus Caenarcaniphilales bacterium]